MTAPLLTDALARALCVAEGRETDTSAHVGVGRNGSVAFEVEAWVTCRPRALLMIAALEAELTADGVAVLEMALGCVQQAAKVGRS